MTRLPRFTTTIIEHLTDPDPVALRLNWIFFRKYTFYPKVLLDLFQPDGPWGKALAALVTSENTFILKQFLDFSIGVWKLGRDDVTSRFCAVMMPSLGQVGCVYTGRKTLYKDDHKIVELIEEYVRILPDLRAPGAPEFYQAFLKHTVTTTVPRGKAPAAGFRKSMAISADAAAQAADSHHD
jgi:hypothetical protein